MAGDCHPGDVTASLLTFCVRCGQSARMEDTLASDLDLISITQLRQVANQTPQPYRLHVQIESRIEQATSSGSPF